MKYYLYKYVEDRNRLPLPPKLEVSPWSDAVTTGAFQMLVYKDCVVLNAIQRKYFQKTECSVDPLSPLIQDEENVYCCEVIKTLPRN